MRRKALISAAIDAIHDRGMGQVTMGEIARRAGVSAALAHHYFGGKDQLLLATMRHLLSELGEEIQARLARGEDAARAALRGDPRQFRRGAVPSGGHLRVACLLCAGAERPEARRLLHVYTRRLESNLLHALRALTTREHALRIAETAASLIDGVWIRRSLAEGGPDPEGAARLVEDAVVEALRRSDA